MKEDEINDDTDKVVIVKEKTLNLLKITGISAPFFIIRKIYRSLFHITEQKTLGSFLPIYTYSFVQKETIPENYPLYTEFVKKGIERMKKRRIVLCGCVRDEEKLISTTIKRLEKTGKMFKDYRIVIFESDSKDNTLKILRDIESKNEKIKILSEQQKSHRYTNHSRERMKTMAYCRNKYLDFLRDHFSDFDYMMVSDLDLYGGWSNEGIANSIGHDDWDMIGANGLDMGKYYDSFPLRINNFKDRAYTGGMQNEYNEKIVFKDKVKWKEEKRPYLEPGQGLMPVFSCFAGMALYRIATLKNARYGSDDCEHVSFHEHIHQNGFKKFFINPSMIVIVK